MTTDREVTPTSQVDWKELEEEALKNTGNQYSTSNTDSINEVVSNAKEVKSLRDCIPKREVAIGCIKLEDFETALEYCVIKKIKPATNKEEANWEFSLTIDGKHDEIVISNSELMRSPAQFNNLFKSRFGKKIPIELLKKPKQGEPNVWDMFQEVIERICKEVDPVESQEWIDSDLILDKIACFTVISDKVKWANQSISKNTLYPKVIKGETYYLAKSEDVSELVKTIKIKTSLADVGGVWNRRGYKRNNNPAFRIDKHHVVNPVWWFTEKCLLKKGLRVNPVQTMAVSYPPVQIEEGY